MSSVTKDKIEHALHFLGISAIPADCDICEDGSVWHGLTQVMPPRSIQPE